MSEMDQGGAEAAPNTARDEEVANPMHAASFREEDWIRAKEVHDQILSSKLSLDSTLRSIAMLLRNGDLEVFATKYWASREDKLSQAFKTPAEGFDTGVIPVKHWRYDKQLASDRDHWRWKAGAFFVTKRLKPRERIMMKGVRFRKDQLMELIPDLLDPKTKARRGRKPDDDGLNTGWLEVFDLALTSELKLGSLPQVSEIVIMLQERLVMPSNLKGTKNQEFRIGMNRIAEIASLAHGRLKLRTGKMELDSITK